MAFQQPRKPKVEAARIEKAVDMETLLTTGRDMLKLRDWYVPKVDGETASQTNKRGMNMLANRFQGKIVRYLDMGRDAQKRILAANLEVIDPPPSSPDAAMAAEEEKPESLKFGANLK